jgi:hypothetical protein
VTAQGAPFGAAPLNLRKYGYVEEEFYISGTGNRYRITDPLATAELIDGGHPYVLRILVRRPKRAKDFNGIVVVEWFNVSTSQDVDFTFSAMYEHLLREGYAFVGVSAQKVGINTLRTVNPARYGSLTVEASNEDPQGGLIDPPGLPGLVPGGDVLSWDIFGQTGAMLRAQPHKVLGSLKPKLILALGESQSAGRLTSYYNSIQPLHNVYDGFLTYDRARDLRTDTGVKSISVATEFGADSAPLPPDSDSHRWYVVAGGSHISLHDADYVDPMVQRDGALGGLTLTEAISGCIWHPVWSRVPNGHVLNAGIEHLVDWIKKGKVPPTAPRLERTATNELARDAEGRVLGGVRLAGYDAPIADNRGAGNVPADSSGSFFCVLAGAHFDFSDEELCDRYGSHGGYVRDVKKVTLRALKAGLVLKPDAVQTIKDAAKFNFPKHCRGQKQHASWHKHKHTHRGKH